MTTCCTALALATLLAAAGPTRADKDLHIPAGKPTSWNWVQTDGARYRWDICSQGYVSSGTNGAYSTGLQLNLNGTYFSLSSQGNVSQDGREVEIGPWTHGTFRVWRRIYVDPKLGYCRWIDIFQNTSTTKQTANLQYVSNMGSTIRTATTTSGKPSLDKKDWGIVTATSSSSRPALVHVFATKGAKVRPTFHFTPGRNNSFQHRLSLTVEPKKTVAVCLFEAQRRPYAKAVEFLKRFRPSAELRKVSPTLRHIIVNMGGSMLSLGTLELMRDDQRDQVILASGDQLLGKILNESFVIDTALYGKLELPAQRVLGLSVPSRRDPRVLVALVDGQVVGGTFVNAPLQFRLVDGNEMPLKTAEIETASYQVTPEKPDEIPLAGPMVVLRDGQRLLFRASDADYTFATEYGRAKLEPSRLRAIELDTPEGGLHRAIFQNDSVLSGLMVTEDLKLALDLRAELAIRRHMIRRFLFPAPQRETRPELSCVVLRNDDELFGKIAEAALEVQKGPRKMTIDPDTIAELTPLEGPVGGVRIRQHNGTIVTGRLTRNTIRFQIAPGPLLPLFVGHVTRITCPKPPPKPPQTQPSTRPGIKTGPANAPDKAAGAGGQTTDLRAQLAATRAQIAKTKDVLADGRERVRALYVELKVLQEAMTEGRLDDDGRRQKLVAEILDGRREIYQLREKLAAQEGQAAVLAKKLAASGAL